MKKRTKIKVLGVWVAIKHVEGLYEDHDMFGEYDSDTRTIRLEAKLEGSRYKEIERHEVWHALAQLSGLSEMIDPKLEESIAVLLEQWKQI